MPIRIYKKEDQIKIERLIEEIYKYDEDLINYYKFNTLKNSYFTAVAIEDNKITGCGSLWNNRFHNNAAYIGINVLPDFRNNGIGSALFDVLEKKKNRNNMQCMIKSDNKIGIGFAEHAGFKLVRKTFEPVYDLKNEALISQKYTLPDGFSVCSVNELQNHCELTKLYKKVYDRNHSFNKVSNLDDETWNKIIFDEQYESCSFVVFYQNEIAAFSLAYNSDDNFTLELGVRGVNEKYMPFEKEIVLYILSMQFRYAKENGYHFIKDEIDDCDSGAMAASELSDLSSLVSLNAYFK